MSKRRTLKNSGWVNIKKLPKGPNGKALCRFCKKEVKGNRRSFCSDKCVREHLIRSNPGYLRKEVFKRDLGVCSSCGVDTIILQQETRKKLNTIPLFKDRKLNPERKDYLTSIGITEHHLSTSLWQAHHHVAVVEGGGECGIDNITTQCIMCHKAETKALRARLKKK